MSLMVGPEHHSLVPLPGFVVIFVVKVVVASTVFIIISAAFGMLANRAADSGSWKWLFFIMRAALRTLLLAFAILGIFFHGRYEELGEINVFWYVACVIWGLSISFDSSRFVQPVNHPPPC